VLALDNGDTFHGTFVAGQSRGEAMLPLMDALEFDATTLHWEFAYGPAQVRKPGQIERLRKQGEGRPGRGAVAPRLRAGRQARR